LSLVSQLSVDVVIEITQGTDIFNESPDVLNQSKINAAN